MVKSLGYESQPRFIDSIALFHDLGCLHGKQLDLPEIKIVNLVATTRLNQKIELSKLAFLEGFLYDEGVYHCAYLRDGKTKGKVSVFSSGNLISTGTRRLADAKSDLEYAVKRLVKDLRRTSEHGRHSASRKKSRY
jgi:TATA-box binding protein (TBP) (component of TFIID and TFIIIB)